ncbi:MAG: phosphatidylserine/phosphatidylglycerophosphate/cardiolipin synthase family protein [Myxococcota bacterium]|nr:phosphatidylserine/phosphatidylglycerophosphate/cardiolipin synthase family protein [Myxococcota bacterium]
MTTINAHQSLRQTPAQPDLANVPTTTKSNTIDSFALASSKSPLDTTIDATDRLDAPCFSTEKTHVQSATAHNNDTQNDASLAQRCPQVTETIPHPRASERLSLGSNRAPNKEPRVGSPEFEAILDATTNSVSRKKNLTRLLFDGINSFKTRLNLIRGATKSIYLQTFIFDDDITGMHLARELVLRAQEGVDVRVIYDGVGSLRAGNVIFDYLRENGVQVQEYGNLLTGLNSRWHEKHLIVDNQASIEGGMNIANEYAFGGGAGLIQTANGKFSSGWRDLDVYLQGPIVEDTARSFLKNWEHLSGESPSSPLPNKAWPIPPGSGKPVRFVHHSPINGDKNTRNLYLQAIASANESITIETAYFIPPEKLHKALIAAAERGVKVKIMTNSHQSCDFPIVVDAARYFYHDLINAGVEIFERNGSTLHSKSMVVDSAYSIVGSVNMNGRSQWRDSECVVAISDKGTGKKLENRFESGVEECNQVFAKDLKRQTWITNLKQWAVSFLRSSM